MSVIGSYLLGRVEGEDHFSLVRIYEVDKPFEGPYEEFLLGEPVHLKTITMKRAGRKHPVTDEHTVWWIQHFKEAGGTGMVEVGRSRNSSFETLLVPVLQLEKLNAMERLAVEYAS